MMIIIRNSFRLVMKNGDFYLLMQKCTSTNCMYNVHHQIIFVHYIYSDFSPQKDANYNVFKLKIKKKWRSDGYSQKDPQNFFLVRDH